MADPRHPMRDNSRALGLVSDRSAAGPAQPHDTDGENGDDFARALDAALDAIRTAIDDEPDPDDGEQQQAAPDTSSEWTMPQVAAAQGATREQRAFREISSDIAARHPELRSISDALKPEQRNTPMPNAATLASKPLSKQRRREPLSYEPYSPQAAAPNGRRTPPTAAVPANDMPEMPQPSYRAAGDAMAAITKEDYWSKIETDVDLTGEPEQRHARSAAPSFVGSEKLASAKAASAKSAPHTRAMQPEDLPSFGNNHDDVPPKNRSKGRVLVVSAIALTAALGFGAVAVWLGNDMASKPADGSIKLAAATPAAEPSSALPPASADNPARLLVAPVTGQAGDAIDLDVALTAAPGERTAVLISGLPSDAKLSSGVDTGKGVWIVKPVDLDNLKLKAPVSQSGSSELKFELVASNGLTLDVQSAQLTLEPGKTAVSIASEPVVAGLAPKPVKTATVTFGAPPAANDVTAATSARDATLPAPPIAPRAEAPAQISGGGGGGNVAVPEPANVQIADRPAQPAEPVQNLLKSPADAQPASQPVRLAAISPAPAAAPAARVATPQPLSPEMQELVQRGHALMEIGDLASARLFYERAAEAGSADAALAMAKSYDPIYFEEQDVHGLPPNPERALQWYEKAAGLGSAEATSRLSALKARL